VTGSDGAVWFTEWDDDLGGLTTLGRITTTGVVTEYAIPNFPWSLAAGPDGALWLADFQTFVRVNIGPVLNRVNSDFDRNGVPDLVWQNDSTRQVGVWFMGPPLTLTMLSIGFPSPGSFPGWTLVTVHDMNGDGIPDLIWQKDDTRQVRIWYMGGVQGMTLMGTADPAPSTYLVGALRA
jgi:hypothetical protein